MSNQIPSCRTCPFWLEVGVDETWNNASVGECHRFPPTPGQKLRDRVDVIYGDWPGVAASDWCGEHPDADAWSQLAAAARRVKEMQARQTEID